MSDESSDKSQHGEPNDVAQPVDPAEAADAMSPEAIAKRVDALGEEDAAEKIAREEEQKLAERRAATKGGKGRGAKGLEAAATKRLQKIGGKVPPKKIAQAADVDFAFAGSGRIGTWMRQNRSTVGAIAGAAVLVAAGLGGYAWWTQRTEAAASAAITEAVLDEQGRIGEPPKDEDDENAPKDPRPLFKTEADRRDAALAKYREVQTKYKGTGAAYLARLEEGSLLLDKGDLDGAIRAFTDAGATPLASADAEVKGRALEGLGFAYEAKATATPAEKDKWLDQAATEFRALENTDVEGFKELGMYHQARVAEVKGEKDKAVQLLKSLHERISKPGTNHPFVYLETVAEDRLRQLDPTALPPKPKAGPMGMGGPGGPGGKMDDAQIQKLIEQLKRQQQQGGGAPIPPPEPK
ncbi:MAG TPA: hypothetical protein VGI39_05040 [Polyangiaceae bacterium]